MKKLYFVLMFVLVLSLTACEFKLVPEETTDSSDDTAYDYESDYNYEDDYDYDYNYDYDIDPYVSVEGDFSVKFLGTPDLSIEPIETDYGVFDMHFYTYEDSYYKAYMLAYIDYPDELFEDKDVDLILEDVVGGMTEGMNVDYTGDLSKDGYPGKAVSANDGEMYMDADLFLVGNRLYQVAVVDFYSYAVDAFEFLDSFELL